MAFIIDGYNLLHATGIVGHRGGPATFARSRGALIEFLADALPEPQRLSTCIVFDACDAPRGLPDRFEHRGITVCFARGYEDADTMIEQLIRADHTPRKLTVVSSDHRIQRAARRRRARAVDSDVWYEEIWAARRREAPVTDESPRPRLPLTEDEVEKWLATFGKIDLEQLQRDALVERHAERPGENAPQPRAVDPRTHIKPGEESYLPSGESPDNPFPPGYGEDLLGDE
jgi:predicted RNA-binding protein with PIN domain